MIPDFEDVQEMQPAGADLACLIHNDPLCVAGLPGWWVLGGIQG